jgi:penicillin-binding protein 2
MLEFEKDDRTINLIYRIFYIVVLIFAIKVINIQVINHSTYFLLSERNRIRSIPKVGPRGNILTSDGICVAISKPTYSVIYFPRENISDAHILNLAKKLSKISNMEYGYIYNLIVKSQNLLKPVKVVSNISSSSVIFFYEIKNIFPELEIVEENKRYYPYSSFLSHIIGYTGKMSEEDAKIYLKKGYSFDAYVGKVGVEKRYEEYLKGKDGGLFTGGGYLELLVLRTGKKEVMLSLP